MADVSPPAPLMQSAVRIPTPEPEDLSRTTGHGKRKDPSYSRSPSPPRRGPRRDQYEPRDGRGGPNGASREEVRRQSPRPAKPDLTDAEKQELAKKEYQRLLEAKSGGVYIPPFRLRALQQQITDTSSKEYQRMAWDALKKAINGLINKVNVANIKAIVPELFSENMLRGRGLFVRYIMRAQAASLPFTPVYAAMAAVVNTKLPNVGELLMNRLIVQFRKSFRRNDRAVCISSSTFIAHLCNHQVVHELVPAQILQLLLSRPNDESVEIAVGLTREVGQHLEEMNGAIAGIVFDQFRKILHEGAIDKRTQYMVEVLFEVRKNKYKDHPSIKEELDLVDEEEQITHQPPNLDDPLPTEDSLNIFKFDPDWEKSEEQYKQLKAQILGEDSGSEDEEDGYDSSSDNEETKQEEKAMEIKDRSNTDLTNLRRTIYLTINSSADFEECCHKLMKINLPAGQESELPSMIIETCSQRPIYEKFYGLIGERFARLNRFWTDLFEQQFVKYYETIHRYESSKLRNIATFFSHLLATDAIGWHVLSIVHINEEETTASSRIFVKVLFQEIREAMGMNNLKERMTEETLQPSFAGLFPKDNPRNTRFAINYFTSIDMGIITQDMREFLNNLPKPTLPAAPAPESDSESASSYSSYSSRTGSSRSRSRSRSDSRYRSPSHRRNASRSDRPRSPEQRGRPTRRESRSGSYSRSRSFSASRSRSRSKSPPRRRERNTSSPPDSPPVGRSRASRRYSSASRSPAPRNPRDDRSLSRSRSPPRRSDRRYTPSVSRSRSPPQRRRPASESRSPTPPPRRSRRYSPSRSRSRTPPPRRS